jgi:hypothetical protein
MRIASPERRWRAATAPLITGAVGWIISESVHLGVRASTSAGLSLTARLILCGIAVSIGLWLAVLIMRTHLSVNDDGLADHRMFRVICVPWSKITRFEIDRPKALWGGFCITVICDDGTTIDLMSTRAYSRLPSARHVDELYRICWTLGEAAERRME